MSKLLLFFSVSLSLLCSCFLTPMIRIDIDELHKVCVRYIGEDGYLYGRNALFNNRGASVHNRYSHRGVCAPGAQGVAKRVTVCLVASSPCMHDRTTNVWEDQIEQYFERYPGSYRGECEGDPKPDTCGIGAAKRFSYPEGDK